MILVLIDAAVIVVAVAYCRDARVKLVEARQTIRVLRRANLRLCAKVKAQRLPATAQRGNLHAVVSPGLDDSC